MSVFVVADAPAMQQGVVKILDCANGSAPCRGNLPGPSRRIVVEPIEIPAEPGHVPAKARPRPHQSPHANPTTNRRQRDECLADHR